MRKLAQLEARLLGLPQSLGHELTGVRVAGMERLQRDLEHDHRVDEALLSTVMQIALDPPTALIRRRDDARARSGQSAATRGIRDCGAHQFGELLEPLLRIGRQSLVHVGHGHDAPHVALDDDRS